jgi:hypothetical protein
MMMGKNQDGTISYLIPKKSESAHFGFCSDSVPAGLIS